MFDDIRPFYDHEVPGVLQSLLRNVDFFNIVARWRFPRVYRYFPWLARLPISIVLRRQLGRVESIKGFQDVVSYFAKRTVSQTTDGFVYEGLENLDKNQSYIFVSNHRDIAGDSMLLDYALYLSGFKTVRIAVGDNLVQVGFATDLMKLNKSFFIKRSEEGAKKIYASLVESSRYIHQSLADGHSIWIAQGEGRAKDGMDVTDPAIIKMFALADRKADFDQLIGQLNIVPMAISYEYDPCDVQKATELHAVKVHGAYQKPPGEDLVNLVRGLGGYKGRVTLRIGTPVRGNSPEEVASEIDKQIRANLELFPINYWALAQLHESPFEEVSSRIDKSETGDSRRFEERLARCPEEAWQQFLHMYANPVVNKFRQSGFLS